MIVPSTKYVKVGRVCFKLATERATVGAEVPASDRIVLRPPVSTVTTALLEPSVLKAGVSNRELLVQQIRIVII
jgi:hypothetical protein